MLEMIIDEGLGRAGEPGVAGLTSDSKPFNAATLRVWRLLSLSDDFLSGRGLCAKSREGDGVCRAWSKGDTWPLGSMGGDETVRECRLG